MHWTIYKVATDFGTKIRGSYRTGVTGVLARREACVRGDWVTTALSTRRTTTDAKRWISRKVRDQ